MFLFSILPSALKMCASSSYSCRQVWRRLTAIYQKLFFGDKKPRKNISPATDSKKYWMSLSEEMRHKCDNYE